jgi:multimeric flavodoxin WrbA
MARVVGVVGSARKDGYTVRVLDRLLAGAREAGDIEVECVHLLDHAFGPCRSCYACIRNETHRCVQGDDMGQLGRGDLWRVVEGAHAMVWASPVHGWMADALIHLFVERLYPFLWSGELKGIPVATLAVASNQGFQEVAHRMLCQFAFTAGARYVGGLPVHAAYLEAGLRDAAYLGRRLGEAALRDEREGRRPMTDEEIWLAYEGAPWSVYPNYVENLTHGTGRAELSIVSASLARGTFSREEAVALLEQAQGALDGHWQAARTGTRGDAIRALVRASALWTHATWKEFLETDLIGVAPPKAYRPLDEQGD